MKRWGFCALLWYICIMFVQPQNRFTFLWPLHIAELTFLVAFALHAYVCLRDGAPLIRWGPGTCLGITLLVLALLATYCTPFNSHPYWHPVMDGIFKNALLLVLIEAMCTDERHVWAVEMAMLLSTLWWIKAGIRLSAAGATAYGDRLMGGAASMIENPNGFAYSLCFFVPAYLYAFEHTRRPVFRWAFLAGALASVFVIFQTGSRTGLVTLLALAVAMIPHYRHIKWRNVLLCAVAVAFIIPFSGEGNIRRFKTIPESAAVFFGLKPAPEGPRNQDEQSSDERQAKNRDTWRLIKDYPLFGVGIAPDAEVYRKYPMATGQVHCEILMAGRQMGFIGMTLYAGFIAFIWVSGWRIGRLYRDVPHLRDLGWLFRMQAFVFVVGGFFCPGAWHPIMLILAGSASALVAMGRRRATALPSPSPTPA